MNRYFQNVCPSRLPDPSPTDYWQWGHLKILNTTINVGQVKNAIKEHLAAIQPKNAVVVYQTK